MSVATMYRPFAAEPTKGSRNSAGQQPGGAVGVHTTNPTPLRMALIGEAMDLHVYHAENQEYVIAKSPEDAAAVYAEAESTRIVVYEDWKPTTWEAMPDGKPFQYHDDGDGTTQTKPCGEWATERGRGYFASVNY